jgi:hypothetical protein
VRLWSVAVDFISSIKGLRRSTSTSSGSSSSSAVPGSHSQCVCALCPMVPCRAPWGSRGAEEKMK